MADKVAFIHGAAFAAAVPAFTAVAAAAEQVPAVQPLVADGIVFSGPAVPVAAVDALPVVVRGGWMSPISEQILHQATKATPSWEVALPFERVRFFNPELAASIATIGERDGLPRDGLGVPVAPSDALSDTQLFESAANPAETWLLPRYRVRIDRLDDGTERYRIRLAPRPPGHALAVTLEPYPAPELASAAATAGILHHELAIVLRYSLGGSGIEKEVAFPDLVTEGTLLTATATLASLPEATEVYFALTEPAANAQLIVRRLVQVAIPVVPPPDPGTINWSQIFVQPLTFSPELLVPVTPGDPVPPEQAALGVFVDAALAGGAINFVAQPGVMSMGLALDEQTVRDHRTGAVRDRRSGAVVRDHRGGAVRDRRSGAVVRDHRGGAVVRDHRVREDVAVDPVVVPIAVGEDGPPPATELRYRVVSRTLDDRPAPSPFFFAAGAHGYIFEGFAAADGSPSSSIAHQVTWEGRSHTYYQEANRRHIFYHLPDSFKLVRTPNAPHKPFLSVEFRSPDGGLDGMRAIVRFAAAPYADPDRLAAAAQALRAQIAPGTGDPSLEPLLVDPSRLGFSLMLPGAGAATPVEGAILDVRLGLTAALDLALADFQAVFDALFAGGASVLFSGIVAVTVGDGGKPAEQVPFRGRLDDLVGERFDYSRENDPAGGLRVTLGNAIESPMAIEALGATLMRDAVALPAAITGLDLPIERLEPTQVITFTAGAGASPAATVDDTIVFDLSGVRVIPDKEQIWASIASSRTAAFLRKIVVVTLPSLFAADGADPLLEIDVELRIAGGGLTKTAVLTADAPAFEVTVPFPLASVVLGKADAGAFEYKVSAIRPSGQVTRDWRTVTGDRVWILAPDTK